MPVRIVVAPDSFKGSLDAAAVCEAIARGIHKADAGAIVVSVPMADGGEGTVPAVVRATGGRLKQVKVTGPLGEPVDSFYGIIDDGRTAVMEMASAAGLPLVPEERRNPLITTTRGVGELIADAIREGCRRVVMGIGGSATNDGGAGMAQALGVRLLDATGCDIGNGGAALLDLSTVSVSGLLPGVKDAEFIVACDVDNPLYGPRGAAAVFGPQKGATPEMVHLLDTALERLARIIEKDLGRSVWQVPGAGAAGGLGAGLMSFLGATLKSGVELVIETVGLEARMQGADFVITGEGRMDEQTLMGKVPQGVARRAMRHDLPVVAIVGSYRGATEPLHLAGIDAIFVASRGPETLSDAMAHAALNIESAAEQVYRWFRTIRVGVRPTRTGVCKGGF